MAKKIIIESYVDHDGIFTTDERKKILNRLESAFNWLGASIPKEIELDGEKYKLRDEIEKLILKDRLSDSENEKIEKLITSLEKQEKSLTNIVKKGSITDDEALELSNKICGILRAVHELRDLMKKAPKTKVFDAKQELMENINDKKRWIKYLKKIE